MKRLAEDKFQAWEEWYGWPSALAIGRQGAVLWAAEGMAMGMQCVLADGVRVEMANP